MSQLNKLQLKAEILTILSKLQMDIDSPYIEEYLAPLYNQDDKNDILDILLKELFRANESQAILICLILIKVFPQSVLKEYFWEAVKNPTVSDSAKTVILNILKDYGKYIDIEEVQKYFDNPQNIVDAETKRLLDNAVINPESQIDFIDFLNSLSYDDKLTLIQSLAEDYSSDELANLLNPIVLYTPDSDLGKNCIQILGDTKSQLALYTLQEVLEFIKDEDTKTLIKKNISKLKIAGIREENAMQFYKEILPSVPYEGYASYPDGHGNQAVIFSREKEDSQLQMVAIVVNDSFGIVDCFGFNSISKLEFNSILDKFYGNDERVYMDEHSIKRLLLLAENISRQKNEEISYEYICWRNLFADITCEILPLEITLASNLEIKKLSEAEHTRFCMMNFIQKWFFSPQDNDIFGKLIYNLDEMVKNGDFKFDLENIVEKYLPEIFQIDKTDLLDKRLLMSAYLKYLAGYKTDASIIFSVYSDKHKKTDLMKNILRKSIYEHYVTLKYKQTSDNKTTNIFSLKNKTDEPEIPLDKLKKAIKIIEDLWVI